MPSEHGERWLVMNGAARDLTFKFLLERLDHLEIADLRSHAHQEGPALESLQQPSDLGWRERRHTAASDP